MKHDSLATSGPVFTALRIAELMAADASQVQQPTEEQRRIIEHPLNGTALVVAGAGSGKTETMANRVVWLVANGLVRADEILGLTFTRKAAGELAERVQRRLAQFGDGLAAAAERGLLTPAETARASELSAELEDGWVIPEIATYDSFAGSIVQEFGMLAGISPNLTLIDQAVAWGLAQDVIRASSEPELLETTDAAATLVEHTVQLDHAMSDNMCTPAQVTRVLEEFSRTLALPYDERDSPIAPSGKIYAPVRDAVASTTQTKLIVKLATAFAEEKQQQQVIEFSDQLRLARVIADQAPEAAATLRLRHRAVLLDEVQDTSVGQTRLLSRLFAGSAVMAVGDPHQSIYGWRGASAESMDAFHQAFRAQGRGETAAATLNLSLSWRNPGLILEAANTLSAELREQSSIDVVQLNARPDAGSGAIEWLYPETLEEEQAQLAQWMLSSRQQHLDETGTLPTAAIVLRSRKHMAAFSAALNALDIPNHIVGVGGLLATPEVTDLVSTLRCIWYADAGSDLIRLLAGPRFRLGVSDLDGLHEAARWFALRDISQQRLDEADLAHDGVLLDHDRRFTILDALDEIASMRSLEHQALRGITSVGRTRLQEAGLMLRELRAGLGAGIPAVIRATERALRLDIELDAAEHRGFDGSAAARANIDAFSALVDGFLEIDEQGTLSTVLAWLEQASIADESAEHAPEPVPGSVQLITGHGAKGLEWDIVAIARLVDQEFPSPSRDGAGWLRAGQLPDELRGDAAARPNADWRSSTTQKEVRDEIADYRVSLRDHRALEERRLAYVAVTRSRSRLLLTGSFWGGQKTPRDPSPYLRELEAAGLLSGLPERSTFDTDPTSGDERTLLWPLDPLGRRAQRVIEAAQSVTADLDDDASQLPPLDPIVELLLAEQRATRETAVRTGAPDELANRLTASTFHEFVADPEEAERHRLRPLPQRPYRRTRLGNLFHEWVERRSDTVRGTEIPLYGLESHLFLEEGFSEDGEFAETDESQLASLIERFERSRWATLQPIAVELEIAIPFAGRRLVCKLDAIYQYGSGDDARYEIVDWKSGRPPKNAREEQSRFLQLDLYRHAYAQWANIDPARIDVSLFYVADEQEFRGDAHRTLEELETLWLGAANQLRAEPPSVDSLSPGV